jgi:hypothetical protein
MTVRPEGANHQWRKTAHDRALGIHDHHPAQHLDRRLGVFELDLPMFTMSTQPVGHHLGLGWIATS